ncbi:hypothetical protein [Spirosoma luteum]|uniref:hypothetical protein n=1 Tax=Spirosoma luteum TaxID=431553 RepID=UPI00035CC1B0|nr:hypothetical protein [Spirosoma luteum]
MENKSTTLLLISLGLITVLVAYAGGLFDWMLDYSTEAGNDTLDLLGNTIGLVALVAYIYFGIRFFNRFVDSRA